MTRRGEQKNAIIVDGISASVNNWTILKFTPFVINSEGFFYEVGGVLIPESDFIAQYPTDLIPKTTTLQEAKTGKRNW